jgi:hypothetical protein
MGVELGDPERAQERQLERPILRITDRGEIFQQQGFGVFHLPVLPCVRALKLMLL